MLCTNSETCQTQLIVESLSVSKPIVNELVHKVLVTVLFQPAFPISRLVPQRFIREDNLNYVGRVPKLDIFLEDLESSEDKDLAVNYHKELATQPYVLLNELLK